MLVPRKSQYALRAVFELAKRRGEGPVSIADIAEAQAIPPRFLEAILSQLRQAGIAASQRGKNGGYSLSRSPEDLTIGQVLRVIQGPVELVDCARDSSTERCPLSGDCVFWPVWERVREGVSQVYDNTTFQDLLDQHLHRAGKQAPTWVI